MKQSIDLDQEYIDQLATQAEELSVWLRTKTVGLTMPRNLPSRLQLVLTVALLYGPLIIDRLGSLPPIPISPDSAECWGGCINP